MRRLAPLAFIVIVAALIAQALSLALLPRTSASAPFTLSPHAHYGSSEPGSEPGADITSARTLRVFLRHGIEMTLDALAPNHAAPERAGKPMSRAAWQASPYYRAGLHFGHWSKAVAERKARRYGAIVDRRFDAAWHPFAARWGYWLGRLVFLWVAVGVIGVLGILLLLKRIHQARL